MSAAELSTGRYAFFAEGESSDSEIDGLSDSDLVPPWLMVIQPS